MHTLTLRACRFCRRVRNAEVTTSVEVRPVTTRLVQERADFFARKRAIAISAKDLHYRVHLAQGNFQLITILSKFDDLLAVLSQILSKNIFLLANNTLYSPITQG